MRRRSRTAGRDRGDGGEENQKNDMHNAETAICWYVMRDLKRANALLPAYKMLREMGFEVFTPMRWQLTVRQGQRVRKEVPYMSDLLFVHDSRQNLEPVVERTPTLQFRFVRNAYCRPMVVRDEDMARFIYAVSNTESVRYYRPGEITSEMFGREIRIIGGPLDGYEGRLLKVRGARTRRLIVELPDLLTVGVEVNPDYIQLI